MEIRTLETFHIVAQELNFTKAANRLNYSQPTVTKHIQSLETELGTTLIEKVSGGYVLTFAGEELLKHTTNILKEVQLAKKISPKPSSKYLMKVQGHDYYLYKYVAPIMNPVIQHFPMLSFKLEGTNNTTTINKLLKNEIDIGLVSGNIATSELLYEKIGAENTALCISKKLYKREANLEYYLEKYPVILDKSEKQSYDSFFYQSQYAPILIDCSSDEVIQQSIIQNNMLGIVRTGRLSELLEHDEIVVIKILSHPEPINVVMNSNRLDNKYINHVFNRICQLQR